MVLIDVDCRFTGSTHAAYKPRVVARCSVEFGRVLQPWLLIAGEPLTFKQHIELQ